MPLTKEDVWSQVQAALNAIKDLPAKERNGVPSTHFLNRYNEMLRMAKEVAPDIDARLWPPHVTSGATKYVEYHTFLGQLLVHIEEDPAMGTRG
jgi:hypothetical protein